MNLKQWSDESALHTLAEAWDTLHSRSQSATIFNSITFVQTWWRHFGQPGSLQLWTVWEDDDRLVGVAPLYETTDQQGTPVLRLVGGVEVSDYLDILTEPGREAEIVDALLAAWAEDACRCPLDLHALPDASPVREAFLRLAPEAGFQVSDQPEEVCPVVSLPDSWDAYLGQLDGKQRRELRRKLRKAGQEALVNWYRSRPDQVEEDMVQFFRLHALSGEEKAVFMTEAMRAFFMDLVRAFSERGWLDLCFLQINGQYAATYLNFLFRNEVLVYNSGFDGDAGGPLSPGWLLLCYLIEDAIATGRSRYDFLQGDEAYKYQFGGKSERVYHLRLSRSDEGGGKVDLSAPKVDPCYCDAG